MKEKNKCLQIRMCVVCKNRFPQKELCRYEAKNQDIKHWNGVGRSFYICMHCLEKDMKFIKKPLGRYIKDIHKITEQDLKEKLVNGECED
ncbi:MAG: DUF448 domain-containing protein [Campylobacter sputorum]|nr:DUF448 domain-containing protein [Campylobacter sputorum]KAB0582137.1 DUF448 domain-containing protein [Campylobacter sputorum subsp. sputorum]MDY6119877.1 DUF448 domain-containing protein [Campylobacter sputorum]QEL04667.1 putative RNA-binding protein (DUF448 domain) [Campylobacter sputorum subsp. sputorum]